jgi:hypothetical protein
MNSDYEILRVEPDRIVIKDLNLGRVSVTNDAEHVVFELNSRMPGKRIFYYDSEGDLAELVHENGRFIDFRWAG